jgi:AcrR family transcriptional regulator
MGTDRAGEQGPDAPLPLIERKQLAAKRHAQARAFELLRDASFDGVSVEQIAEGSDLSPSTVYRYFGTKEGIFLWDERDDAVIDSFRDRLRTAPPGAAMLGAVSGVLVDRESGGYADGLDHLRLIAATPALRVARAAQHAQLRRTLADVIVESGWREPDASTFAGAVVGAFAGAIEAWERADGTDDLTALLARAAELVGDLDRSFLAYPRR